MPEKDSIINLGDISKPATILIEKISAAVGGYFKPYQIKRVARAEAEADIIKAQSQIEITDLQRRALNRFLSEEAKKQENIEMITKKAIPQLTESSTPQNMEDDWVTNFFDKCRIVSDEEMQSLWAKVLAGEANVPGAYSKRTVNMLSSLDKIDAQLFSKLCGFGWSLHRDRLVPLIYNSEDAIYKREGINYIALTHLDDIGLISFNSIPGFRIIELSKRFPVFYFDTSLIIEFDKERDNELDVGMVLLTNVGKQLAQICGVEPIEAFQDYVMNRWSSQGIIISSIYSQKV